MSVGPGSGTIVAFPARVPNQVGFERFELSRILDLYGRMHGKDARPYVNGP